MARYWSQDAENYGNIIQDELASFRVEAWQKLLREKMPTDTHRVLDLGCGPAFFSSPRKICLFSCWIGLKIRLAWT